MNFIKLITLAAIIISGIPSIYSADTNLNKEILDRIFVDRHLDPIKKKSTLTYFFQGYDQNGDFFEDDLLMIITDIDDRNLKSIEFNIFSGKQKRIFPALTHRHQNPVIIIFLQKDADNMAKLLDVSAQQVRSLIKKAFRTKLNTQKKEIAFANKTHHCLNTIFFPFLKENKVIYKDFITKKYSFTMCPDIPGKLYQMETDVKNSEGISLFIERMQFKKITPN